MKIFLRAKTALPNRLHLQVGFNFLDNFSRLYALIVQIVKYQIEKTATKALSWNVKLKIHPREVGREGILQLLPKGLPTHPNANFLDFGARTIHRIQVLLGILRF